MNIFAQLIVNSLITAAFYLFIGFGFSILFGITKFFNVTLGSIAMAGAYVCFFMLQVGVNLWVSMVFGLVIAGLTGFVLEKLIFLPLRRKGATSLNLLVASIGVSIIIEALLTILFSSQIQLFTRFLPELPVIRMFGAAFSTIQLIAVGSSLLLFFMTAFILKKTSFGKIVRAISDDSEVARITGIDTDKFVGYISFGVCFLAGWAGIMIGFDRGIQPIMGFYMLLYGIAVAIIGGLSNIYGALLGALVLAFIQNFAVLGLSGEWKDAVGFAVFIVVLLFRPRGLVGR